MKTDMTITISMTGGEMAYFKIEFLKSDFMAVVDAIADATLENVYSNPLWRVI